MADEKAASSAPKAKVLVETARNINKKYLVYVLILVVIMVGLIYFALHLGRPIGRSTSSSPTSTVLSTISNQTATNTTSTLNLTTTTINATSALNLTNSSTTTIYTYNTLGTTFSPYYIYCAGTGSAPDSTKTYFAQISANGIASWHKGPNLPIPFSSGSCSIYGTQLLCFGTSGASVLRNRTFYSSLSGNWTNAAWYYSTDYPVPLENSGCSIYQAIVYCVGTSAPGHSQSAYYAPLILNAFTGSTGPAQWTSTTSYPIPFAFGSCSIYNGYIYCIGKDALNASSVTTAPAYYAPVAYNGIGAWKNTTNYPSSFFDDSCSIYNGHIYCIGASSAYYAPVSPKGIGAWKSTTSYPLTFSDSSCAISNLTSDIYCVGTGEQSASTAESAYYASISANGIGIWRTTTRYPVPMYSGSCEIPGSGGGFLGGGGQN